jgi:hypothetical protein
MLSLPGVAAILVVLASGASAPRGGHASAGHEAFFRCKDAQGMTRYGDSLPPDCVGQDTEVLNSRGTTVRLIEGDKTREKRLAQEAQLALEQQVRDSTANRDRMLMDTYQAVADIERLRDQRTDLLDSQFKLTEINMQALRDRQVRLTGQVARFRPYSANNDALPLPEHLAEELVNTVKGLEVLRGKLASTRSEREQIEASFGKDIQRFKELKGIR